MSEWCEASKAGDHLPYRTNDDRLVCSRCGLVVHEAVPVARTDPPRRPRAGTQTAAVLEALERGPVCSFQFYAESPLTHRIAARIHDLKAKGFEISSSWCEVHSHEGHAVEYRLEAYPVAGTDRVAGELGAGL